MKMYIYLIVLMVLATTRIFAQQDGSGKMLEIGGQMMKSEIARDVLVTMLESRDSEQEQSAMDVLKANVGVLALPSGELPHRLRDALYSYYQTLPAFPSDQHVSETNVMELMRSPKVFVFSLLVNSGGSQGESVIKAALQGEDKIMRDIATKQMPILAQEHNRGVTNRPKATLSSDVDALKNRIAADFSGESRADKEYLLREVRRSKKELRQKRHAMHRKAILSKIKKEFYQEKNQSIREDLITTIVTLDDKRTSMLFLDTLIDSPSIPRGVKLHAKYVRECLIQGVFR